MGRIMLSADAQFPSVWTLTYGYHEDRTPTHGYEPNPRGRHAGVREELAPGDVTQQVRSVPPTVRLGPVAAASHNAAMRDLLLRRASGRRPSAQWPDDYDVVGADGEVIGRIFKTVFSPAGTAWAWTIAPAHRKDRALTHGHVETQQQAMWAFSRSWRRGRLDAAD